MALRDALRTREGARVFAEGLFDHLYGPGNAADRFEREDRAFFERVRTVYLDRARQNPDRYRIVNADRPPDAVRFEVETLLARWLERIDG